MKIKLTAFILLCFCTFAVFAQNVEADNSVRKIEEDTREPKDLRLSPVFKRYMEEIRIANEQQVKREIYAGLSEINLFLQGQIVNCRCSHTNSTTRASTVNKITLNTGERFIGEILVENEQIVMIRTIDGSRFQFPTSEVQSIERDFVVETNIRERTRTARSNNQRFAMMIDFQSGASNPLQAFSTTQNFQGSLVLGTKNVVFRNNSFFGGGIGYNILLTPKDDFNDRAMAFFPLFLRFQKIIDNRYSEFVPYFGMDVGYGFSLHSDFDGGTMLKLYAGMAQIINGTTIFYSIFAGTQNFSGQLTQTNDFGTFSFHGNSTIMSLGVKLAVRF